MSFLNFKGFSFSSLFDAHALNILNEQFIEFLGVKNNTLKNDYLDYRSDLRPFDKADESTLLCEVALVLEDFLVICFCVESEIAQKKQQIKQENEILRFKKEFVLKKQKLLKQNATQLSAQNNTNQESSLKSMPPQDILVICDSLVAGFVGLKYPGISADLHDEYFLAQLGLYLCEIMACPKLDAAQELWMHQLSQRFVDALPYPLIKEEFEQLGPSAVFHAGFMLDVIELALSVRAYDPILGAKNGVLAQLPKETDYTHLVHTQYQQGTHTLTDKEWRFRDGFALTDKRGTRLQVLQEAQYCIICHPRQKDSCRHGMIEKSPSQSIRPTYKKNPLQVEMTGCPLKERISEFHTLARQGAIIAALAMIVVDNPMCPGTGHRICNDCMKGCIYQKQTPVNIPFSETGILTEVLSLPYGVEIYGLLTRFNPLNKKCPVMKPYHGQNVLVVGMGPAGYTLSHYLLNEGFGVVGIDGLKIEPIDSLNASVGSLLNTPVKDYQSLVQALDKRVVGGFGGVSEYGITVRFDKTFLFLLQLTLQRRSHFALFGQTRLGSQLTLEDAWALGFVHVALATGAGQPTLVPMKNNLVRGMRQASDFLMSLQLGGAFKEDSLSVLQIELPALVIGGGLTAIDTATEMMAYYVVQVEKLHKKHMTLLRYLSLEQILSVYDEGEKKTYLRMLEHAQLIKEEKQRAQALQTKPQLIPLLRRFGGVKVVYRRTLQASPAYRLNHEEIEKALEEGIEFVENLNPEEAIVDEYQALSGIRFTNTDNESITLPAKTVCIAAGTKPNVTYEREHTGAFALDDRGLFYRNYQASRNADGYIVLQESFTQEGFFTSYLKQEHTVSYFGDNHQIYAGSVVKAMASAKHGYQAIASLYAPPISEQLNNLVEDKFKHLKYMLTQDLTATVKHVRALTPTIFEIVVHAPLAARKFKPGQFYRLQNFERDAQVAQDVKKTIESLALTGASCDPDLGLLSLIVLEMGVSSRLAKTLLPGQVVALMGPTGAPTEIPKDETVILCGGGLGNAVLFSIAQALKSNGCLVVYFAAYKRGEDLFLRDKIEQACDQVIYSTDSGCEIVPDRATDKHFRGHIVDAMTAYAEGRLGPVLIDLAQAHRMIVIGSDRMMAAVKQARHQQLKSMCTPLQVAIGSINSPMQCMMKEICAQCLQRQVDPQTGQARFVFTCFNQDQLLDVVDFEHLSARLKNNSVLEKQAVQWASVVDLLH